MQFKNKIFCGRKQIIMSIITAIIIILGGVYFFYSVSLQAVSNSSTEVAFEVRSGEASNLVVDQLKEQDLIKNALMTKIYMKVHGYTDIKAGSFILNRNMSTKEIMEALVDSEQSNKNQVQITFKEGLWAKDIAALIEKELSIPKTDLLNLWNDETYIKKLMSEYSFITKDVINNQYKVKLEGYLFPETYTFENDADAKKVTKVFLDHFQVIYKKYEKDISKSKYSINQITTLASVIQYEASKPEDMALISGVFANRLKKDMPLQSSVTVCYALYDQLTSSDDCEIKTSIDSPYNTYKYKGLPIGAILNPGEEAFKAALYPKSSNYLYFVADIYGDGSVHYARTLSEQEANIDKYNLRK